jgi:hypothetical protein
MRRTLRPDDALTPDEVRRWFVAREAFARVTVEINR